MIKNHDELHEECGVFGAYRVSSAAALSFAAIAASTFFTAVFTRERTDLFFSALFSATKILFFADLMFANSSTSIVIIKIHSLFGLACRTRTTAQTHLIILLYMPHIVK